MKLTVWCIISTLTILLINPTVDIHIKASGSSDLLTQSIPKPTPSGDSALEPLTKKNMASTNENQQQDGLENTDNTEKDSVLTSDNDDNPDDKGNGSDDFHCDTDSGICSCIGVDDCVKMVLSGQCKEGTWKPIDDESGDCNWNV